jgi:AcrR family transcriptional regulator
MRLAIEHDSGAKKRSIVDLHVDFHAVSHTFAGIKDYYAVSHINKRGRGRPRAFEEGDVLAVARDAFWSRGLAGVSLDQISAATGVARPGIAAAFGDKRALYLRTIDDFVAEMEAAAASFMSGRRSLRAELTAFFNGAVELYTTGAPRGCMALCTLPVEAVEDPIVRARLADILAATDAIFAARFRLARAQGELPLSANAAALAALAAALLHSVALRARAGASKASLQAMTRASLAVLCARGS